MADELPNSQNKSASTKKIALGVIALVAVAAIAFVAGGKKQEAATDVAATEQPAPEGSDTAIQNPADSAAATPDIAEAPPQPEAPKNIVVETKKLPLGEEAKTAHLPELPADLPADVAAKMGERGIGDKNAPIKIIEFSSLTCSHCGHFHRDILPEFKSKYIDTGKVYLQFKEFPLDETAMQASQLLRCMPEDKFYAFMNALFEGQESWAYDGDAGAKLKQNAKLAGLSDEEATSCLENQKLKEALATRMQAAGQNYKVQSTPTFVIENNGRTLIGAQPIEAFEKAFAELENPGAAATAPEAKAAAPAAEDGHQH